MKLNNKGFTLIELIVVIAILGLLAGIAIPNVLNIRKKAGIQVDISNRALLKNAANMAIAENGLPSQEIKWNEENFNGNEKYSAKNYLESWPVIPDKKDESYSLTISTDGKISIAPNLEKNIEKR